ncbi:hypothetical protein [Aurantiacibacter aquimixticola]|uniref:DUF3617 family protein n=1 Tax=Aurantiacibacter aquimixticola TaxID=1958945 RepID=A0A419RSU0_9SPHN|nr:hypothetical protein [Aurantiacibacter aquimixticola]RJY08839.1 hypothetical protein D6201_05205 [Aurantiacibacter aquimixticola]
MRYATSIFFLPALALAACSDTEDTSPANEKAIEAEGEMQAGGSDLTDGEEGRRMLEANSPSEPTESGAGPNEQPSAETIPLTPGVYVRAGTSCENPANAAFRVWDGDGLSGSATRDCRGTIVSHDGNRYTIANSCENTYDGSRTTERLTMTVTDQVHFSIAGSEFESCSMAQVPDALQEMVTG